MEEEVSLEQNRSLSHISIILTMCLALNGTGEGFTVFTMSSLSDTLPVIDLDVFLSENETASRVSEECKKVSLAIDVL